MNNTFERLAKMLPDYEPKVTFSKIDILQKTIAYIEELKLKYQDVSIDAHAESSRSYFINCTKMLYELTNAYSFSFPGSQKELEECLRAMKIHNDRLANLLQKSHIAIPPFVEPISLDKIKNTSDEKSEPENDKFENSSLSKICEIQMKVTELKNTRTNDVMIAPKLSDAAIRVTAVGTSTLEIMSTAGILKCIVRDLLSGLPLKIPLFHHWFCYSSVNRIYSYEVSFEIVYALFWMRSIQQMRRQVSTGISVRISSRVREIWK